MVDKVESANAHPGWIFRFKTTAPAQIDGRKLPTGSIGYGVVRAATSAGRRDRNGALVLEPRYFPIGGKDLQVMMDPSLPVTWSPGTTLIEKGLGHVPNPIPGIAMSAINFARFGKNITLGPGFTFRIVPMSDLTKNQVLCGL